MWKTLTGRPVEDIVEGVRELVGEEDRVIHIGTDAQHRGNKTDFVTVITVLNPGKGGRVFYKRESVKRMDSLAQKLFRETELSLGVAVKMSGALLQDITVHVDANEDLRHKSSNYVQALAGMVVGHGFKVEVKPNSWCATNVADRVVKDKRGVHAA
jgi:predicted RNase H-related nuclease YkuK (DUF458 family)